ncbi:MAG TPA: hypothetical protein VIT90_17090 [Lysobacter sp.]
MSEPTDPPLPFWHARLRADIDRCTRWQDVVPLLKQASAWEAVARHGQDTHAVTLAVVLYARADQRGADLHDAMLLRLAGLDPVCRGLRRAAPE